MVYQTAYPWYFEPPYPWYIYPWNIDSPTRGMLTPLSMVYRPLPTHGILTPLSMVFWPPYLWYYELLSFGRNEGGGVQFTMRGFKIKWQKIYPRVKIPYGKLNPGSKYDMKIDPNLPWGSKYHIELFIYIHTCVNVNAYAIKI
jgi:hypothetical protein